MTRENIIFQRITMENVEELYDFYQYIIPLHIKIAAFNCGDLNIKIFLCFQAARALYPKAFWKGQRSSGEDFQSV